MMTKPPRPKLRMAPPPAQRAAQQASAMEKLSNVQRLQEWSEEPLEPPTDAEITPGAMPPIAKERKSAQAPAKPAQTAPAAPVMPWETVPEGKIHPFSMHLPETTYLKADHCWKRTGYKSAKAFYVAAIEAFCAEKLNELKGQP